MSRIN